MSVQDKNVGFELNDTEFPELSGKLTGRKEKGRRSAVADRQARKAGKAGAFLVKTIDDPNHVLGKRRKERVTSECNDGFAPNVVYSMNKNKRWDDVNADSLLENTSELPISVIERVLTAKDSSANVVALHTVGSDGSRKSETASGKGTNLNALIVGEGKKIRGRKAQKEAEAAAVESDGSVDKDEESGPTIQYTIYKPHKNHKVLVGKLFNRGYTTKKAGKTRTQLKKINMDELEASDMENSIHIDESLYKPSRDFKFCLGDFLTESTRSSKAVYVRRHSIESVQPSEETEESDQKVRPFYLLDISSILRSPVAFEWVTLDTSKWESFNLSNSIDKLSQNDKLDVQWLDADKTRVSIDASQCVLSNGQQCAAPILVIIIEKAPSVKKNTIKLLLNSDVAPSGPFSWQILKALLAHTESLEETVLMISKLVAEWKDSSAPECISDGDNKIRKNRYEQHRDNFLQEYNSSLLAHPTQVLTVERMTSIVREEGRNTKDHNESFERIDMDNIDFDACSDAETEEETDKKVMKVKCVSCEMTYPAELFELDDCWQCRECLRKHIIDQIRTKSVPLEIPFALCEGQSAYDILPAIIPLPLLNFYTKIAATEMLETSDVDIGDLGECPSCKQLVHIDRPNEYNICNCVSCGIHWCPDCGNEPHFPLSCSTFAGWIEKWEKEYNLHVLEKTEFLKKIKCACGHNMEIRDKANRAKCGGCGRVFNPQNMKMLEMSYWMFDKKTCEAIRMNDPSEYMLALSVETIPAVKTIKKEFSDLLGQARTMRFGAAKKDFEKSVRKLKSGHAGVANLRDIRKTVLSIVENGLAYVYIEKDEKLMIVKKNLTQLMKQWLDIEEEVHNPRNDFAIRIESIESNMSKTLDLLKSII